MKRIVCLALALLLGNAEGWAESRGPCPPPVANCPNSGATALQLGIVYSCSDGSALYQCGATGWAMIGSGGAGGGDAVKVNGVDATGANLNDTTPAAAANGLNCLWQKDASPITNISCYLLMTAITKLGTITTGVWNGASIADAFVDNTITASNYLPLAGGALTGAVTNNKTYSMSVNQLGFLSTVPATGGVDYGFDLWDKTARASTDFHLGVRNSAGIYVFKIGGGTPGGTLLIKDGVAGAGSVTSTLSTGGFTIQDDSTGSGTNPLFSLGFGGFMGGDNVSVGIGSGSGGTLCSIGMNVDGSTLGNFGQPNDNFFSIVKTYAFANVSAQDFVQWDWFSGPGALPTDARRFFHGTIDTANDVYISKGGRWGNQSTRIGYAYGGANWETWDLSVVSGVPSFAFATTGATEPTDAAPPANTHRTVVVPLAESALLSDHTLTLTGDTTGPATTIDNGSMATTIAANAVTNTKAADMATQTFKGRNTAATGDPEDLSTATAKTMLNLTGTNSGDQTITLTGDVTGSGTGSFAATVGADRILESMLKVVNGPTDEQCLTYELTTGDFEWQACGGGSTPTGTGFRHITAGVEDAASKLVDTADVNNDQITYAKLQNVAGFSVVGKTATGSGDAADITAADETVLGRTAAGNLVFAQVATGQIANSAVTYAKMQSTGAAGVVIGRNSGGAGVLEEMLVGNEFLFTAGVMVLRNTVSVEVDFGAGETTVDTVVTGLTWMQSGRNIVCAPTAQATADRAEGAEDAAIEGLTTTPHTLSVGVGFTLTTAVQEGVAYGKFLVSCIAI